MSDKFKMEVVTDPDDIIGADCVVCATCEEGQPLLLPDNVMDFCRQCGVKVQLRPDVPPGPKRDCYPCAKVELEAEVAKGEDVVIMLTPKTIREVAEYLSRNPRKKE